ncbi:tail fiber protein [Candidatus Margulisiibacteriota bacterium]
MLKSKKILISAAVIILLLSISAFAAAPRLLNFQGRLLNKDTGDPIAGAQSVIFELYDAAPLGSGTKVWDQTISNVECDSEGIFSVVLGGGAISLDTVNFDQPLWMQITYDSQIFDPRQKLTATPYAIHAINGVPVGTILPFGGSGAPDGYLLCDGQAVSRTVVYGDLFSVIDITYGSGDGSTTFNVPDLRGIFPRGAGTSGQLSDAMSAPFSATLGTYQNDQLQGHHHLIQDNEGTQFYRKGAVLNRQGLIYEGHEPGGLFRARGFVTGSNGVVRGGNSTRPANLALNFIIKY